MAKKRGSNKSQGMTDTSTFGMLWFGIGLLAGFSGWLLNFIWLSAKGSLDVVASGD